MENKKKNFHMSKNKPVTTLASSKSCETKHNPMACRNQLHMMIFQRQMLYPIPVSLCPYIYLLPLGPLCKAMVISVIGISFFNLYLLFFFSSHCMREVYYVYISESGLFYLA